MRSEILSKVKRIVVKVGSSILTDDLGYISGSRVKKITNEIADLISEKIIK